MKLSAKQLEAFQPLTDGRFVDSIINDLWTLFPEDVRDLNDEPLVEQVYAGVQKGRSYGLSWDSSLRQFAMLSVLVGPDFDRHRKVRRILADEARPPNERMEVVLAEMKDDEWQKAGWARKKET